MRRPSETGQAVQRARRRLVPFLVLMYVLAGLDQANAAHAKHALQAATGVSEAALCVAVAGLRVIGGGAFLAACVVALVPRRVHRASAPLLPASAAPGATA